MATMSRSPCPLRRVVALAACVLVGPALLAPSVARATDAPDASAAPEAMGDAAMVFGLDALELMRRERRDKRGAPRMLPLLTTRTEHGRLWLGLTRSAGDASGERSVQLEMVWLIPLGR